MIVAFNVMVCTDSMPGFPSMSVNLSMCMNVNVTQHDTLLQPQRGHVVGRHAINSAAEHFLDDPWTRYIGCLARTASRCRRAYILPMWFFFLSFFISTLISEVTERISTKPGHIFTYDCYLFRTFSGIYPHGLGAKNRFLVPTLNFDRTYLCNRT